MLFLCKNRYILFGVIAVSYLKRRVFKEGAKKSPVFGPHRWFPVYRRGQPDSRAASEEHNAVGLIGDVPANSRPLAASAAHPVTTHQTFAHAGHRLLARPLDVSGHHSSGRHDREELHICTGQDDQHQGQFSVTQDWVKNIEQYLLLRVNEFYHF